MFNILILKENDYLNLTDYQHKIIRYLQFFNY